MVRSRILFRDGSDCSRTVKTRTRKRQVAVVHGGETAILFRTSLLFLLNKSRGNAELPELTNSRNAEARTLSLQRVANDSVSLLEIDRSICPRLRHVCSDEQPIVVVQKRNATTSAAFTDRVNTPTGVEGYSNRINAAACACIRSGARHALRCVVPLCSQVLYRLTVSNRREPEESSSEGGMALAFLYY